MTRAGLELERAQSLLEVCDAETLHTLEILAQARPMRKLRNKMIDNEKSQIFMNPLEFCMNLITNPRLW